MSPIFAPSRRANLRPRVSPAAVVVAEARWDEARAITDALVVRLGRERSELSVAVSECARVTIGRRVELTRLELEDARAYESRVLAVFEGLRRECRGADVEGVTAPRGPGRVLEEGRELARKMPPNTSGSFPPAPQPDRGTLSVRANPSPQRPAQQGKPTTTRRNP